MVLGARTRFALFRVQIFRGSPLDHENHENTTPRKIPAIRYIIPVLLAFLDFFPDIICFKHVLDIGVGRSKIEWKLKMKTEVFP